MNFGTFLICLPQMLTFRILGFGILIFSTDHPGVESMERQVWAVWIFPGWRFAFVAPWL